MRIKNADNLFCAAFSFTLLFPLRIPVLILLVYGVYSIYHFFRIGRYTRPYFIWSAESVLLMIFFALSLFSVGIDMFSGSWIEVDRRLYFVLVPLLFVLRSKFLSAETREISMIFFTAACFVSTIANLGYATYRSLILTEDGWVFDPSVIQDGRGFLQSVIFGGNYFFHKDLAVFMHPTYLSIYILLACIFIITKTAEFGGINGISNRLRWLFALLIVWFSFHLFLLSSRAAILSAFILLLIALIFRWKKISRKLRSSIVLIGALSALALAIVNPRIAMLQNHTELFTNNPRWHIWPVGIEIVRENPIGGTGLGKIQSIALSKYAAAGFTEGIERKYNLHNQYLETWAGMGILGLICLLAIIVIPITKAGARDWLYLFFTATLSINFIFESMLNVFSGIALLTFFMCLFSYTRCPPVPNND